MGLNRLQNVNNFTSLGAGTRRKENFNDYYFNDYYFKKGRAINT